MTQPTPAPLYVAARRVLLDAVDALVDHRDAVILAGAQAVYLRTGHADLDVSVAPFTSDADLTIDPRRLGPNPDLAVAMRAAGFALSAEPGIWTATIMVDGTPRTIPVDLLVPEALAGAGRRAARLPAHGKNSARRTLGLEATIADHSHITISSLQPAVDSREASLKVAGTAALFIAKAHKLSDREVDTRGGRADRLKPKDAGDVIRLMRADSPEEVGQRLRSLAGDPVAGASVEEGVRHLRRLFGRPRAEGVELAVTALTGALPDAAVRALAVAYTEALLTVYDG